jgi:hypothetical protein
MNSANGTNGIYAELHCLSNFSFLRGASHPGELVKTAAELGYAGLALTDECSVAGVVRAHTAAKDLPLKLIVGSELVCDAGMDARGRATQEQLPRPATSTTPGRPPRHLRICTRVAVGACDDTCERAIRKAAGDRC